MQFEDLANNPDVIVATPGRVLHHTNEIESFSLRLVEKVVLDEADRLLEMGSRVFFCARVVRCRWKAPKQVGEWRETVLFWREAILSRGFLRSRGGFFSRKRA